MSMETPKTPKGPQRAAADGTKGQGGRTDQVDRGDLEEQETGNFEGEGQHGWAPDVDSEEGRKPPA